MTKFNSSASFAAAFVLLCASCATGTSGVVGVKETQAVEKKISSLRDRLGDPRTEAVILDDLEKLALRSEAGIQRTESSSAVTFAWTVLAAYAYEGMTLSRNADAETYRRAYNSAVKYADSASNICLNDFKTIDPQQGNLCSAAFSARSLTDSRKTVRDLGDAVLSAMTGDATSDADAAERWARVSRTSDAFGQYIETSWPSFSSALSSIPGTEEDKAEATATFRSAAMRTACRIDRAQAQTDFSPDFAPVDTPFYKAKVSYWTAMASAADFLDVGGGIAACEQDPNDVNCIRQKTHRISAECNAAADAEQTS
ncbi:MAG: hypothetical protein AAFY34_05450 [Pseudomonadota bacterium]